MYLITHKKVTYNVYTIEFNESHIWNHTHTIWQMSIWIIWNCQYFNGFDYSNANLNTWLKIIPDNKNIYPRYQNNVLVQKRGKLSSRITKHNLRKGGDWCGFKKICKRVKWFKAVISTYGSAILDEHKT